MQDLGGDVNCALYVRGSTGKQDTENQLAQLRAFAHTQGWTIVAEYADELTGNNADRAQFQLMFRHASWRTFDVLLFWSLDRLSREGALETLQHLNRPVLFSAAVWSACFPWQPWRYLSVRFGHHDFRELIDLSAFGSREFLTNDGRNLVAGQPVDGSVQLAPLSSPCGELGTVSSFSYLCCYGKVCGRAGERIDCSATHRHHIYVG